MLTTQELKDHIEAKKLDLESRLGTLRADARAEAQSTGQDILQKLEELEIHLRAGWDGVTGAVELKLYKWLGMN